MIRDYERTLFQKIILCILAAMTICFAAATLISRSSEGVLFEDALLDISYEGDQTIYSGKKYGEEITVICYMENGAAVVDFSVGDRYHALCRVEYPEGTITTEQGQDIPRIQILRDNQLLFSGGYNPDITDNIGRYYNEDGTWEPFISVKAGYSTDPWHNYEFTEGNILYFANDPEISVRGSWAYYFITLVLAIITAAITALPNTLFHLKHRLYVHNPEPTDFYYATHNICSAVMTGMVLVLYIMALRMIE